MFKTVFIYLFFICAFFFSILHVLALNIVVIAVGVVMAKFYPNIGGIIRYEYIHYTA